MAACDRAWDVGLRPTAVLAMSDAMAIGAMRAVRERRRDGARGDVSVVGFDDIDLAQHTDPAAHDGPPAHPTQGRGGGPPPAGVVDGRAGAGRSIGGSRPGWWSAAPAGRCRSA